MKSNQPKVQGLEKAKQYLKGILDPKSVLVLPTGERLPIDPDTLEDNVKDYMEKDLSQLDHTVAVDKNEVVLLPIVESG